MFNLHVNTIFNVNYLAFCPLDIFQTMKIFTSVILTNLQYYGTRPVSFRVIQFKNAPVETDSYPYFF